MSMEQRGERSGTSGTEKIVELLDEFISLQLAITGVLIIIGGFFVQFIEVSWTDTGVWSAVMAIWGTALFLLGAVVYAVIWWSYR